MNPRLIFSLAGNAPADRVNTSGDADKLVPIQQAEVIIAAYKKAGVSCELVVKKGADHGWAKMDEDRKRFLDWFDKHLADKK